MINKPQKNKKNYRDNITLSKQTGCFSGVSPTLGQRVLPPEAAEARPGRSRNRIGRRNQVGCPSSSGRNNSQFRSLKNLTILLSKKAL